MRLEKNNKSLEHIIPNSIGGKLKSSSLLCRKCNNHFGENIDAELGRQFEDIVAYLNLKRDRNKQYIIKNLKNEKGEEFHLLEGRNPCAIKPIINIDHSNEIISITAKDRRQILQIIKGLKRNYPTLDDNNIEDKFIKSEGFMNEPLKMNLSFGGEELLLSIAKIALNRYVYLKGDLEYTKLIIGLLNKKIKNENFVHFYHLNNEIQWGNLEVSHSIFINGCNKRKILFANIILFSSFSFIVNLDEEYLGEDFEDSYCFDVLSQRQISRNLNIDYNGRKRWMMEGYETNRSLILSLESSLNRMFSIGSFFQAQETMNEIKVNSANKVLKNYPPGTIITNEIISEIVNEAAPILRDFMLNKGLI